MATLFGGVVATADAAPMTAATRAPSCVHTSVHTGTVTKTFRAVNRCSSTERIRFILARHTDSDCYTLSKNEWVSIKTARTAALSGIDLC